MSSSTWLIYALGGGLGHLTRSCALARAALPDVRIRILTNSPYAACVQCAMPELDIITLDPAMNVAEARGKVAQHIQSAAPDCLIVDTFPRGLGGELADVVPWFPGFKVLVQRDLNPQYAAAFDLNAFIRKTYDLVLIPGDAPADGLGPFPQTTTTAPWLVRSQHEVWPRNRARALLGFDAERPSVIVCATGGSQELDWFGDVVSHLLEMSASCEVRCIAPVRPGTCPTSRWMSYWPAIDLHAAADVVVGGAGYNTIYECLASGVPLIARPWPRKYDRQHLRATRASSHGSVIVVEDPRQAAAAAIAALTVKKRRTRFHNGATDAVRLIMHRIRASSIYSDDDTDPGIGGFRTAR